MAKIEEGLHNLHGQSREGIGMDSDAQTEATRIVTAAPRPETFVRVNLVSPDSPAERAGIKVEDEIAKFGTIDSSNFSGLKAIGELVQNSKDQVWKAVHICSKTITDNFLVTLQEVIIKVVRKNGDVKELSLYPKVWSGRGLLGCNIVPIETCVDR